MRLAGTTSPSIAGRIWSRAARRFYKACGSSICRRSPTSTSTRSSHLPLHASYGSAAAPRCSRSTSSPATVRSRPLSDCWASRASSTWTGWTRCGPSGTARERLPALGRALRPALRRRDDHRLPNVQELYSRLRRGAHFIPYGSEMDRRGHRRAPGAFGLQPDGYIFCWAACAGERCDVLIEAFEGLSTDLKLVIVGDAPYGGLPQVAARHQRRARGVQGYVYGDGYRELSRNAALFVAPTEVGSTHPVIVEAMAAGNCVVVNDYAPQPGDHRRPGVSYPGAEGAGGLRRVLAELLTDPTHPALRRTAPRAGRAVHS